MTEEKRPLGATIVVIVMFVVSLWWLVLGFMYFFGSWWWLWYEGFPFAWLWGIMYGFLGLIGLGIAGGLAMGVRQAYNATLILVIIDLVFSIPALVNGYGITGAILSGVVLVILLIPGVKAFFRHEIPPPTTVARV